MRYTSIVYIQAKVTRVDTLVLHSKYMGQFLRKGTLAYIIKKRDKNGITFELL